MKLNLPPGDSRCYMHNIYFKLNIHTFALPHYPGVFYEFESRSGRGVQHYVIKFASDLRQVGGFLRFPPPLHYRITPVSEFNNRPHVVHSDILS
jgi:hypothetical protein